jgi:hypothetical protein
MLYGSDEAFKVLGSDFEALPTGPALRSYWINRLPDGERKILEVVLEAYPKVITREYLDDQTGYKRSSRDTYLKRLGSRRLVEKVGTDIRASESLFE